ncbi:MAG: hypothetical protein ABH864_02600 [archaeon]
MAKRIKRVQKGVESLVEEIEKHFLKLEGDIREGNIERGRYHFKEIEKSLLKALEIKLEVLGGDLGIVGEFRARLVELRKKLEGV